MQLWKFILFIIKGGTMEEKEQNFEVEVLTRLAVIESKLDKYSQIEDTTYRAYNNSKQNEKDIKEIQDKLKWVSRTSIGAIITGLIGIIFFILENSLNLK